MDRRRLELPGALRLPKSSWHGPLGDPRSEALSPSAPLQPTSCAGVRVSVAGMAAAVVLVTRLCGFAIMYLRVFRKPLLYVWSVRRTGGGGAFTGLPPGNLYFELDHFLGTMALAGTSVAASWIFLLASGAWRPERGWIDRAGRALGWFWIITLPLTGWWDFHLRF